MKRRERRQKKKVMVHVIWEGFKLIRKTREGKVKERRKKYVFYNYYLLKMKEFMKWTKIYIFHII